MMIQRTRSGGTASAAAIAGNAMFIMESSDTASAPAATTQRDIPRMMTRHAGSDRLGGLRRRRVRYRHHHAAARRVGDRHSFGGPGADGRDAGRQSLADLVEPR